MAPQKCKKKISQTFFCIFECLLPQNPTNQSSTHLILQGQMEDYHRIQKPRGSRELFPPEKDFKT